MRSEHPAAAVGGDATPAGRPQPRSIPTALVLGRHLVGWVLACGVIAYFAFGYRAVTDWLVLLAVVLVLAGTVTGAAALFFTRTQAAKSTGNFILSAWVFIGLIALGTPNGLKYLSSQSLAPTSTGAPSAASQAEAPPTQFSDESLPTMAFRRDGRARKPAWSPGGIDDASLPVDALMESAKRIPALAETRAWSAVLAWQQDKLAGGWDESSAFYVAVGIVLEYLPEHGVCRPGRVFTPNPAKSHDLPPGTVLTAVECDR